MSRRKKPLTPAQDLAKAERRAKAAKTPIAKVTTQQVVDKKRRVYSGESGKEARATADKAIRGTSAGTGRQGKPAGGTQRGATRRI